ncbi:hypothetical protein GCG21_05630 [Pseudactinotalea sp. HY160]|uniref:hypothetical protein n=1 Tax=Pseudactinotalea sp. HY160 TaxID=2654490 RepID=UPI00128B7E3C|nr:hypothetical protein [Pseudactinotalea sp. HY160]MPV49490.1 hypothetical protein [Pseudactinotalea sp. HY160]
MSAGSSGPSGSGGASGTGGSGGSSGTGGAGGTGGSGGAGAFGEDDFDLEAFDADFAAHFGATTEETDGVGEPGPRSGAGYSAESGDADESGEPGESADAGESVEPGESGESDGSDAASTVTAVVLTPLAHAPALARLMGLAGMDWPVVPTRTGAVTACAVPVAPDDLSALTGELPGDILDVAKALSHTSKYGVVLLTARVTHSAEEGPGGNVSADRYVAGKHVESLPPGLVTTGADDVVEQLVLGQIAPADVPGALDPATEAAAGPQTPGASGNPTKRGPKWRRP